MKVLAFYDDCGHLHAFDVSTPAQEHKILEGICKEAAQKGFLKGENKKEVKTLLENQDFEALYERLSDCDIMHFEQRHGPGIVEVQTQWQTDLGIGEL
jgi:hypothetical protein